MGAFGDKLKAAGYDTFEAKFYNFAIEALRLHPDSVVDAWRQMGNDFGYAYLRERMKDMTQKEQQKSPPTPLSHPRPTTIAKPYVPRQKVDAATIQRGKAKLVELMFGLKTTDGRDWAEIGAHELKGMTRDGKLAQELEKEAGHLEGNMRFANLRELLTAKQFAAARERARV